MCTMLQVSLVSIPSREELRQKNLFSVSDCKMYWQSNGDYLAVKVCFSAACATITWFCFMFSLGFLTVTPFVTCLDLIIQF